MNQMGIFAHIGCMIKVSVEETHAHIKTALNALILKTAILPYLNQEKSTRMALNPLKMQINIDTHTKTNLNSLYYLFLKGSPILHRCLTISLCSGLPWCENVTIKKWKGDLH